MPQFHVSWSLATCVSLSLLATLGGAGPCSPSQPGGHCCSLVYPACPVGTPGVCQYYAASSNMPITWPAGTYCCRWPTGVPITGPPACNWVLQAATTPSPATPCTKSANCNGNHANSVSGNVPNCNCNCKSRYRGNKCHKCASGRYNYPTCARKCTNSGNCNNKATSVSGYFDPGTCSCTCQSRYSGGSCQSCASGRSSYPTCRRTCTNSGNCNSHASSVSGYFDPGTCSCTCASGATSGTYAGASCNTCANGYDSYPGCHLTCTNSADCNSHATSVFGNYNTGCTCTCATGAISANYVGATCNSCANGYDSYPNCYLTCTNWADCNGYATSVSGNSNTGCTCTCREGRTGGDCSIIVSPTNTWTATITPADTPTFSPTKSDTRSTSPTESLTVTPPESQTPTVSESQSASQSWSSTQSQTPTGQSSSISKTWSLSLSDSNTQTMTLSVSQSVSKSQSFSLSVSASTSVSAKTRSSSPSSSSSISPTLSGSVSSSVSSTQSDSATVSKTECAVFGPVRRHSVDFLQHSITVLSDNQGGMRTAFLVGQLTDTNTIATSRSRSIPTMTGAEFTNRRFELLGALVLSVRFNQPLRRDVDISHFVLAQEVTESDTVTGKWDPSHTAKNSTLQATIIDLLPLSDDPFHTLQVTIPYTVPSSWLGDPRVISVFVHRGAFRCEEEWIPGDMPVGFNFSVVVQRDEAASPIPPIVQTVVEKMIIVANVIAAALGHPSQGFVQQRMGGLVSLSSCFYDHKEALPAMTSPLGQKFGSEHGGYYRGGIVGNLGLLLGLMLLCFGIAGCVVVAMRLMGGETPVVPGAKAPPPPLTEEKGTVWKDYKDALATLKMPSMAIVPIMLAFQGTTATATALFAHSHDQGDVGLAVVGGLICSLILGSIGVLSTKRFFRLKLEKRPPVPPKRDSKGVEIPLTIRQRLDSFINDTVEHWVNLDDDSRWKEHYFLFFHDYKYSLVFFLEVLVCYLVGILEGVRVTDYTTCVSLVAAMAFMFLCMLVVAVVFRPSLTQFQQTFLITINGLSFTASICLLVGMLTNSPRAVQATLIIGFVIMILGLIKLQFDLYAAAMWAWGKRPWLKKAQDADTKIEDLALPLLVAPEQEACMATVRESWEQPEAIDPEIDAVNEDGWTALHVAAKKGDLATVKLLVSKGASLGAATKNGYTALHFAAGADCSKEMTAFLISKGAPVDAVTKYGATAFHQATELGHRAAAELILAEFLQSKGHTLETSVNNEGWVQRYLAAYGSALSEPENFSDPRSEGPRSNSNSNAARAAAYRPLVPEVTLTDGNPDLWIYRWADVEDTKSSEPDQEIKAAMEEAERQRRERNRQILKRTKPDRRGYPQGATPGSGRYWWQEPSFGDEHQPVTAPRPHYEGQWAIKQHLVVHYDDGKNLRHDKVLSEDGKSITFEL